MQHTHAEDTEDLFLASYDGKSPLFGKSLLCIHVSGRRKPAMNTEDGHGNTVRWYPGMKCDMYSLDITKHDLRKVKWIKRTRLEEMESLFLGLNHPLQGLITNVHHEHFSPLPVPRRDCVYVSHSRLHDDEDPIQRRADWLRFHLNNETVAAGGYIKYQGYTEENPPQTPMWIVPHIPL